MPRHNRRSGRGGKESKKRWFVRRDNKIKENEQRAKNDEERQSSLFFSDQFVDYDYHSHNFILCGGKVIKIENETPRGLSLTLGVFASIELDKRPAFVYNIQKRTLWTN